MNENFIGDRITKLRLDKDISERELSLSLGKAHNYIYSISSGKILPTMKSFLEICDYFDISPSDFFNEQIEFPNLSRDIVHELNKLSHKELSLFLDILKTAELKNIKLYLEFMNKFRMTHRKK